MNLNQMGMSRVGEESSESNRPPTSESPADELSRPGEPSRPGGGILTVNPRSILTRDDEWRL